ncbi:MAG: sigma 54-interacting transcriptional regulator [Syntrophaceae bacterium]|nr:sigma 54-interacting transcriptional regulator [Syntrophaceae bacterium]
MKDQPHDMQDRIDHADASIFQAKQDWVGNIDFRQMVEDLQIIVCVYDIDGFIYLNPVGEKMTGYSLEEVRGKRFWEVTHPEDALWIKPRGLARLRGETVPPTREFRIIKKNGQVMWVNVFWMITPWHGKNTIIMACVDVTENKRLTEELQASRSELETRVKERTEELNRTNKELLLLNQNLNNILKNISDGVATVNQDGDVLLLNAFLDHVSGHAAEEIKRRLSNMILEEEDGILNKMLREKKTFSDEEIIFPTAEGSLNLLVSGTPILDEEGAVQSGVIVLRPMKDVHRLIQRFSGYRATFRFEDIITDDPIMLTLIENAKNTALGDSSVVIEGASGTGKELFAQAIHNYGSRSRGPFIAVNCGAIPRELIASELFGYAEGAFTGAKKSGNPGKFELASGGTLFLDEIGDMSIDQQVSLLRVIQEKRLTRIGGHDAIPVDVRIICATNKDLYSEMRTGSFRNDLYYRLNVINIKIPPLRERRGDIMLLFNHFMKMAERKANKKSSRISSDVQKHLINYSWPGNVRELQNVVERMVNVMSGSSLETDQLPQDIKMAVPSVASSHEANRATKASADTIDVGAARELYRQKSGEAEKQHIIGLLELHHGNISRAAREIGMSRTTLYKKIRLYNSGGC